MGMDVYRGKVNTKQIVACILDALVLQKHEYQCKQTTHNLCTQVAKCIEAEGGIFEHFVICNTLVTSV
jgi:hypothetical protein